MNNFITLFQNYFSQQCRADLSSAFSNLFTNIQPTYKVYTATLVWDSSGEIVSKNILNDTLMIGDNISTSSSGIVGQRITVPSNTLFNWSVPEKHFIQINPISDDDILNNVSNVIFALDSDGSSGNNITIRKFKKNPTTQAWVNLPFTNTVLCIEIRIYN